MVRGSPAATFAFLLVCIHQWMVLQHVIAVVNKLRNALEPENWNPWRVAADMLISYIVIWCAVIDLLQSILYLVRHLSLFLLFTFFDSYGRFSSSRSVFGKIATTTYLCEECRLANWLILLFAWRNIIFLNCSGKWHEASHGLLRRGIISHVATKERRYVPIIFLPVRACERRAVIWFINYRLVLSRWPQVQS